MTNVPEKPGVVEATGIAAKGCLGLLFALAALAVVVLVMVALVSGGGTTTPSTEPAPAPAETPETEAQPTPPSPVEHSHETENTPEPAAEEDEVGSASHAGDTKFCGEHECIGSFTTEEGTVVECSDGAYSHAGGISGACSHHGGEKE
jgi:hypothetical protein